MDKITVDELYKEYSSKVVNFLTRFVGKEDAEDLMQEVFVKVNNSLPGFKGDSKISTWIYKIATNSAIDYLKSRHYRQNRDLTASLDYVTSLKSGGNSGDNDVEYQFLKEEMNQCIADYINKLQDNYRAIFLLKEYEYLSFEEVADIMGISVDNVKIRLHRARKKLHELLLANCSFYYDEYSKLCCTRK